MADDLPPNVRVVRNLSYGDDKANKLDLYLPENMQAKTPVIIWIHGGGWQSGEKAPWPALTMVNKGYVVASIDYTLSGDAKFPAQIDDTKKAVRWLRDNADKYNLDPDRFGAWGTSAGGHLAALLGTSASMEESKWPKDKKPATSAQVQAVCDWCGPTDLKAFSGFKATQSGVQPDAPYQMVKGLLGGSVKDKAALAEKANPITFISDRSPPFLIVHGERDGLVPIEQSKLLQEALKKKGVAVELMAIPEAGHGLKSLGGHGELPRVEQFFDTHLRSIDHSKKLGITEEAPKALATFSHQAGKDPASTITLYSNGRINKPEGMNTWTVKDDKLILTWFTNKSTTGTWIDTLTLDKDGKTYQGKNLENVPIRGKLTSGVNLRTTVLPHPEVDTVATSRKDEDIVKMPVEAALGRATGARWEKVDGGYTIALSDVSPAQRKDAMTQFANVIAKETGSKEGLSFSASHIKIDDALAKKMVDKFAVLEAQDKANKSDKAGDFIRQFSGTKGMLAQTNFERSKAEMESLASLATGVNGLDKPEIAINKTTMSLVFKDQAQADAFSKLLVETRKRAAIDKEALDISVPNGTKSVNIRSVDLSNLSAKEASAFFAKAEEVFKEEKNKAQKPPEKVGALQPPAGSIGFMQASVERIEEMFGGAKPKSAEPIESGLLPAPRFAAVLPTNNKDTPKL